MPMTYDYFGAFDAQGPTAPHSPLTSYTGIPQQGFYSDAAIQKLKSKGVPASKLLLGIGFYGRGWTGVTQAAPGGTRHRRGAGHLRGRASRTTRSSRTPARPPAPSPAPRTPSAAATGGATTPRRTINGKMTYAKNQGLGGAFFWELSGDTSNGELIGAIKGGLG